MAQQSPPSSEELRAAKETVRNREITVTLPAWIWGFVQEVTEQGASRLRNQIAISHGDYENKSVAHEALTKASAAITTELDKD